MRLIYRKSFIKALDKLTPNQKKRVGQTLKQFESDHFHPTLNNHALQGKLKGLRSISVGGDLRILFAEEDNYAVVYLVFIGSHSQAY